MKGRKKFIADLSELRNHCKKGMTVDRLVIKGLRVGDDEGAIEFRLLQNGTHLATVNLLISDTAEYPEEHACIAFAQEEVPYEVRKAIEDVPYEIPRSVKETVTHLVNRISHALKGELNGNLLGKLQINGGNHSVAEKGVEQSRFKVPTKQAGELKGIKRFTKDLTELRDECKKGMVVQDLVIKGLIAGDDEGSVEFRLVKDNKHIALVNLFLLDMAEYPKGHTWLSFTQEELSPAVTEAIEDIAYVSPRPLRDTVTRLVSNISKALTQKSASSRFAMEEREYSDDGEADDFEDYDHAFEAAIITDTSNQISGLRKDFQELVGAGYRPGITRWSHREFVVSVSVSILDLNVPSAALAAWDRQLLSTHQHFTLLITGIWGSYPLLKPDGCFGSSLSRIKFYVGLSPQYKPSKDVISDLTRGVTSEEKPPQAAEDVQNVADLNEMTEEELEAFVQADKEREEAEKTKVLDPGRFERFALSSSLESLLNERLFELIKIRSRFGIGWAGAEILLDEALRTQNTLEDLYARMQDTDIVQADREEGTLSATYSLPPDPLSGHGMSDTTEINFPLVAYCYLIRRLTLCSLYCLICHRRLKTDFVALKPYVCDSKLCAYHFYEFGFGPSMEYEVRNNSEVVDLLVSLAYVSAMEGQMDEGFPVGLGLRVNPPRGGGNQVPGPDGLVNFDTLDMPGMRSAIVEMIDLLPKITEMKEYLDEKILGNPKRRISLQEMNPDLPPAAWKVLRWIIASSTAYLESLSPDEQITGIDAKYRQFRFSVGSPDAENKFSKAVAGAKIQLGDASNYRPLYAFHGSPLRNWHSIIRQGLLLKNPLHGRSHGHGVYFATDGSVSMGYYAMPATTRWKNSTIVPTSCLVVVELVNLPRQFVCSCNSPCFVVANTSWIITRYLLVATAEAKPVVQANPSSLPSNIPTVQLDPVYHAHVGGARIGIPEHSYKLSFILQRMRKDLLAEEYDDEDKEILASSIVSKSLPPGPTHHRSENTLPQVESKAKEKRAAVPDWKHEAHWTNQSTFRLMPPPTDASPRAAISVQRELRAFLKEQENATSLRELGFYMPPELMSDNLFQWMVELHSFDPTIPIAQDMKARGCNSILFEIRFPPTYPQSPPFFRIIKPRFLPFIQGGGGHVTGGGSICIDLLTSDGWIPKYTISAILLQIKLAISDLEPRPARLAPNWNVPYGVAEALAGYKRAARTHGWQIPAGTDRLLSS